MRELLSASKNGESAILKVMIRTCLCIGALSFTLGLPASRADTVVLHGVTFDIKHLEVGSGENALLLDDFNDDGFLDLVATRESDDNAFVMFGDGEGGFGPSRTFPAGDEASFLASADINRDGHKDLVVANHNQPHITVLLGRGSGAFSPAPNSPLALTVAPHPHMVAATDLDNDNEIDIIVDSRDRFGVFILRGLGNAVFDVPGIGLDVEGEPYLGFAVGDINGDSLPDLATPNRRDVSIMLNTRSEPLTFERRQSIPFASPIAVAFADMNSDSQLDLVVVSEQGQAGIGVFVADDAGRFDRAPQGTFQIAAGAKCIAVGDIDNDTLSDVVVTSWNSDIRVVFGGKSKLSWTSLPLGGLEAPWRLAIGDLNRDGYDDIVVSDGVTSLANVYLSQTE